MPSKSEWEAARLKYETRPGVTYAELGEMLDCSHQAVWKRAKKEGWIKAEQEDNLPVPPPKPGSLTGLRSDENIAEIINTFALTGKKSHAARAVGICTDTLDNWIKETPELSVEMQVRREKFLLGQISKIANSRDWNSAKYILQHSPETKEQYGETHDSGPRIVLNIHRDDIDGVVIDHD